MQRRQPKSKRIPEISHRNAIRKIDDTITTLALITFLALNEILTFDTNVSCMVVLL
jgi:hypothetical protein